MNEVIVENTMPEIKTWNGQRVVTFKDIDRVHGNKAGTAKRGFNRNKKHFTEGEEYFLKPMNCPHHCEIYKSEMRSYRDLPLRLAEFGTVYRYEQHGELNGLLRTRGFTQDDAHIFCRKNQVEEEISKIISLVKLVLNRMVILFCHMIKKKMV